MYKIGTASGLIGGLVSSAYLMGMSETAEKKDNPGTFAIGMFSLRLLLKVLLLEQGRVLVIMD